MIELRPVLRRVGLCAIPVSLLLLAGCATGSIASFTQAPLFFSESADEDGNIVASSEGPDGSLGGPELADVGDFDTDIPEYLSFGGNAVLPVNALLPAAAQATLGASGAQAGLAAGNLGIDAGVALGSGSPAANVQLSGPQGATGVGVALDPGSPSTTVQLSGPQGTTGVGVSTGLAVGSSTVGPVTVVPAARIGAPAVAPVMSTLTTTGAVLGTSSAAAAAPASPAVNALMNTAAVANKCLLTKC